MTKIVTTVLLSLLCNLAAGAQTAAPLKLQQTIMLPGVTGKFDHFAFDLDDRYFVCRSRWKPHGRSGEYQDGEDSANNHRVRQTTWSGVDSGDDRLYVADGKLAQLKVYQGSPSSAIGTLKLSDDADDMVYDGQNGMLYVGHGGSNAAAPARVAVVDTKGLTLTADLPVAAHPEALGLDAKGQRIFANIADAGQIAIIGGKTNHIVATWKLTGVADNVPMAYDAVDQVLFVACRKPAVLLVLDANTGKEIFRLPTDTGADDLFYDANLHRVYVITGAGLVDVYAIDAGKHLSSLGRIATEQGAKTGLFVSAQNLLYVGIPGVSGSPAQIRVYATNPGSAK